MLSIYLLGGLTLRWHKDPLPPIQTTRARALFAYLVLNRRTLHDRAVLAGTFWPDIPEEQARRRLRQALWHIGRRVDHLPAGSYLLREGEAVGFNTALPHWIDVAEFESLNQGSVEEMARAVSLYRGPLLPEVFDDWVLVDRERLRERWLALLERLASAHQERGELQPASEVCRMLLSADPWHEPAACLLMRLLAGQERVGEALQVYFDLRDCLQSDLGISPASETTALYHHLRAAHPRTSPLSPPSPPHPGLIGRVDEMAVLEAALQSARRGQGRVVLVAGLPGIGKTHLAQAAAEKAYQLGFQTLYACAVEPFGPPAPYSPLDQALRTGLEMMGRTPSDFSPLAQAALSALLPDRLSPPAGLDAAHLAPAHFHAALSSVLTGLADPGPLLLILDDLHWADPSTWAVLHALLPRLTGSHLVLIVAFRPADLPAGISSWPDRFVARPAVRSLPLSPFSLEEVTRLTTQLLGHILPSPLVARLHRETGGNPLFIVEMVRGLAEKEDGPSGKALPIPATLRQAISARLGNLSPQSQRLLHQAAVLGDDFDFDLIRALSGKDDEEWLLEQLDVLLDRGLLVEKNERYRFTHSLVRRVLYDETHPRRRRLWHRRAAQTLAHLSPRQVAARARHARAAEEWPQALELALTAAEQALALFAVEEALAFYRVAQEAEERLEDVSPDARLRRLRGLAQAHRLRGEDEAEACALEQWRETARSLGAPEAEALALAALADNLRRRGCSSDALPLAQEAVRLARPRALSALAPALHALGSCHEAQGDLATAPALYRQAMDAAQQANDPRLEAECLNSLAIVLHNQGNEGEAASAYRRAAALSAACGDRLMESRALNNLAIIHTLHGDLGPARRAYEGVLAAVETMGNPEGTGRVQLNLAEVWIKWGDLETAHGYLISALERFTRLARPVEQARALMELARLAIVAADLEQALTFLRQAYPLLPRQELREEHLMFHSYSVDVHLALGDAATAADHTAQFAQMAHQSGMGWLEGLVTLQTGQVAAAQGDLPAAVQSLRWAVQVLGTQGFQAEAANAQTELGLVLHRLGREGEAEEILSAAWEEMARRMLRPDAARLLAQLGRPPSLPGQQAVELPRQAAPLRRHLTPQERITILWTPDAGSLEPSLPRVPLRRARIRRLLTEAAVQTATPGVRDLSGALNVSPATIKADLAALRQEGWPAFTRGHFPR